MGDLQDRKRWEPAEAEARIFARWLESGLFHPEPAGTRGRELLDRHPAAERHRRAAHGPRAQRLDPGHADPPPPHARQAGEVDPRHGPRRHRHPDAGRAAAASRRARAARRSAARRSSSACGSWREEYGGDHLPAVPAARRLAATTRRSASRSTRATSRAVLKVFVDLYDKGLIYRDNYMVNWDPGSRSAISDLEVEEREVTDTLYYVDYPLTSGHGSVTVATVRPGDDAGRHRDRRAPRRRALHAARRGDGDAAARRPPAADHRRPLREARVRHGRAEDHARARPQRLRDRPRARPRGGRRSSARTAA